MNYDQPRQIADGPHAGKWHYTSANRRTGTHPIGYCSDHGPHDTEDEARACYRQYERSRIKLDAKYTNWSGCEYRGCDKPTKTGATAGPWRLASLCEEHLTTECAIVALGLDGPHASDSMHS